MVLLLAAVPLLLAIAAVVWVVRQQSDRLAQAQIAAMQPILLQARKDELQHFVQIGRRAVARLYEQTGHDPQARQQALELLRRMDFGNDNYFFVYDLQGNSLMHPRLPDLEGHSQWELRDSAGAPIIQQLVRQAQAGGGFVDYMWNRPSTGRDERKLGYVELVPEWGWVMGTGLYLDHLQETQALITRSTAQAVQQTRQQILLIASAALLLVAGGGLALNLYEQRAADTKLRAMAQKVVHSQEDERSRVARELHDGISQQLLSVKFVAESALLQLERGNADAAPTLAWCATCAASRTTCVPPCWTTWAWPARWRRSPASSPSAAASRSKPRLPACRLSPKPWPPPCSGWRRKPWAISKSTPARSMFNCSCPTPIAGWRCSCATTAPASTCRPRCARPAPAWA